MPTLLIITTPRLPIILIFYFLLHSLCYCLRRAAPSAVIIIYNIIKDTGAKEEKELPLSK